MAQRLDGTDTWLASPEELSRRITALTCERQSLREAGGSQEALERNRLEIARSQYELSRALIHRFLRPSEAQAA